MYIEDSEIDSLKNEIIRMGESLISNLAFKSGFSRIFKFPPKNEEEDEDNIFQQLIFYYDKMNGFVFISS